jgi:hypothetical protein
VIPQEDRVREKILKNLRELICVTFFSLELWFLGISLETIRILKISWRTFVKTWVWAHITGIGNIILLHMREHVVYYLFQAPRVPTGCWR